MATIIQKSCGSGERLLASPVTPGSTLVIMDACRNGHGIELGLIAAGFSLSPEGNDVNPGSGLGGATDEISVYIKTNASGSEPQATTGYIAFGNNHVLGYYELSPCALVDSDAHGATGIHDLTLPAVDMIADDLALAIFQFEIGDAVGGTYFTPGTGLTEDCDTRAFDGHPGATCVHHTASGSESFVASVHVSYADTFGAGPGNGQIFVFRGVQPPPDPGPVVDVYDPEGVLLANLTGAFDVKFRPELNGTGSGEFKINRHDPDATAAVLKEENFVRVTVPQIDANHPTFGFFLETGDFTLVDTAEEGGEIIQFGGRGGLAYWDRAIWLAESFLVNWWTGGTAPLSTDQGQISFAAGTYSRYTVSGGHASSPISFTTGGFTAFYDKRMLYTRTGLGPITLVHIRSGSHAGWYVHPYGPGVTDRKKVAHYTFGPSVLMSSLSANKRPGEVLHQMYLEGTAVDRPAQPISEMTVDFDDTVDSDGNAWTTTDAMNAVSAALGDDYLSTIGQLLQTGAIDVDMDPDLGMHAYNHYGRDKHATSFASNKVIFRRAVNVADQLRRVFDDPPVGTFAEVLGNEDTSVARVTLLVDRPSREISVHGDSDNIEELEALGSAQLEQRLLHSDTIAFRVDTPIIGAEDQLAGLYLPGRPGSARGNYWLGDIVTLDTGTGVHDFDNEQVRIWAITFEWDAGNNLKITVEVGSGFGGLPAMGSGTHDTTSGFGGFNSGTLQGTFQELSEKDEASGYAGLDENGHLYPTEMSSLNWKNSVRVIDTAGGTLASDFAAGSVVDGVTLAEGDEIALAGQTSALENGIRIVQATGAPTRRPDLDSTEEFVGTAFMVREGAAYSATIWRVENSTPPVVDTDAIVLSNIFSVSGLIDLNNAVFGFLDHGNLGATETFDVSAAGWHKGTLNANCAATFIGATVDRVASMVLELVQEFPGGHSIDFPSSLTNELSLESSLDTDSGSTTYYVFFSHDGGTNWIGFIMGGGAASGTAEGVPLFIASGEVFTIPANRQVMYAMTIDNEGTLVVDGYLVLVD